MLDIPSLLLAGSALKPTGQTLLVGDHRQLATVTQTDWTEIRRQSLSRTQATLSALEYVQWLNATTSTRSPDQPTTEAADGAGRDSTGNSGGGASDDV